MGLHWALLNLRGGGRGSYSSNSGTTHHSCSADECLWLTPTTAIARTRVCNTEIESKTKKAQQEYVTALVSSLATVMLGRIGDGSSAGRLLMLSVAVEHRGQQAMPGPGIGTSQSKHEINAELFLWLLQGKNLSAVLPSCS